MSRTKEPIVSKANHERFEAVDASALMAADRDKVAQLKRIWDHQGPARLRAALTALAEQDAIQYVRILGAFLPHEVSEDIKTAIVAHGFLDRPLEKLLSQLTKPA